MQPFVHFQIVKSSLDARFNQFSAVNYVRTDTHVAQRVAGDMGPHDHLHDPMQPQLSKEVFRAMMVITFDDAR